MPALTVLHFPSIVKSTIDNRKISFSQGNEAASLSALVKTLQVLQDVRRYHQRDKEPQLCKVKRRAVATFSQIVWRMKAEDGVTVTI